MQQLGWALVAILAVTTIVFLWLWLQARMAQRAAEQTMQDMSAAFAGSGRGGEFSGDNIYKLLAKGQIGIGGAVHNFGVSQSGDQAPQAFLSTLKMDHLQPGDAFSSIRGTLHKVDIGVDGAPQPEPSPVAPALKPAPAPEPTAPAAAPAAPQTPVAPEPDEDDDEDAAERTIMFAPSRGKAEAAQNPYSGFPFLRVTEGPDTGTDFPLPFTNATIGRDKSNIIALADTGSSRLHCEVQYRQYEFVLTDANSTNGTLCNGEKITEKVLAFGDTVQVADTVMTFSSEGFEKKDASPDEAIEAFEQCLEKAPDFILALQNLAFLLERNVARQKEAEPLWKRIMEIDQRR